MSPRRAPSTPCATARAHCCEDVRLFAVYTCPQIGEGRKSLTLALRRRRATGLTADGPDAVVGKHTGVAGDGGQFGMIAVGVNLEQVAALRIAHPYSE